MQSFEFYWTPTYLILVSAVTGCVSISDFASLVDISVGVTSSAVELKFFVITEGVKKYKSIIKKKKKKYDKRVFLANSRWNSMEILISKTLIDWNITHVVIFSIVNVLKEYDDMKEEIKIQRTTRPIRDFSLLIKQCYLTVSSNCANFGS